MSHVTVIKVEFKDLDCIKAACEKLGLVFKENQQTYKWYGRHVGDYALPAGFTKADLGKCSHAIGVKGSHTAYEVGLVKQGDHYIPMFDFWAGGYGLMDKVGKDCQKLIATYSKEVALKAARTFAKKEGYTLTEAYDAVTEETTLTLRSYT